MCLCMLWQLTLPAHCNKGNRNWVIFSLTSDHFLFAKLFWVSCLVSLCYYIAEDTKLIGPAVSEIQIINKHAEFSLASLPIRERMTRFRRREKTIREWELLTWNGERYAITLSRLYSHPICVACIVYRWDPSARQLEVEQAPWKTTPTFIDL